MLCFSYIIVLRVYIYFWLLKCNQYNYQNRSLIIYFEEEKKINQANKNIIFVFVFHIVNSFNCFLLFIFLFIESHHQQKHSVLFLSLYVSLFYAELEAFGHVLILNGMMKKTIDIHFFNIKLEIKP